jgi:hypothetical protein
MKRERERERERERNKESNVFVDDNMMTTKAKKVIAQSCSPTKEVLRGAALLGFFARPRPGLPAP